MRFLRTNTATRVTVGPMLDKTDGITPEVALTVTNCKVTFMVDTAGVPTLVIDASATASGGDNDMVHVTNDDAGFYDLELTAAQVNYVGRAMLAITDAANHCPVFHEFMILGANAYDALTGADNFDVNVAELSGDSTAADNAELMFDGTGYAGGTARLKVDLDTLKTQAITCGAGVTVLASVGTAATSTAQTGDSYALANGASGFVAIKGDTAAILSDTGTDGVVVAAASKTGYALADATSDAVIADAVWNAATATYGGVGSYGVLIETDLDATVSSRASQTSLDTLDDYVDTEVAAIKAKTDQLNFTGTDVKATLDGETVTASSVTDKTGYAIGVGGIASTAFAAGAIDAAAIAANAIGASEIADGAIDAGAIAADAITAAKIADGAIDAATFAAGAINAAAIAADAIDADALAADAANEIADALLARNVSGGSSAGRTVKQALHVLRNKATIAAGTLTVYDTDDSTSSWTASVSTTAGDPISTIDPA